MPITRVHQSNFNRGEVDPNLIARNDLSTYGSSLKKARNVIVNNQGSVERRPGTVFRADLGATSRLESFIFSGSQEYIFAFQNTVPTNEFVAMTGEFELFGIDAGFPNHSFGPSFSNPGLTTTFDLVTLIETEVIDVVNDIITDPVAPIDQPITDVQVEIFAGLV